VVNDNEIVMDVTFRNLNEQDARIVASYQAMYSFIYEWRERVIRAAKEGISYDADALRTDFHESMSQNGISEIFY